MPTATDQDVTDTTADDTTHGANKEAKKPKKAGEHDGEVKNGYRWDRAANEWVDHRGIDFTAADSPLPHNMEHSGDGSPEHPHQLRQVQRWS